MLQLQKLQQNHTIIRESIESIVQDKKISDDELAITTSNDVKRILKFYSTYSKTEWSDKQKYEKEFVKMYLLNNHVPISEKMAILFNDIPKLEEYAPIINITPYVDFIISFMNSKVDFINKHGSSTSLISILKALNSGNLEFTLEHIKKIKYDVLHKIINLYASSSMYRKLTEPKKKIITKEDTKLIETENIEDSINDYSDESDDIEKGFGKYYSSKYKMSKIHMLIVHACMITPDIPKSWYTAFVQSAHPKLQMYPMCVRKFKGELLSQLQTHYENVPISPIIEYRRSPGILLNNSNSRFYSYIDFKDMKSCYCNSITFELPYMSYAYISHVEIDVYDKKPTEIYLTNGKDYNLERFKKCDKSTCEYKFERETLTVSMRNDNYDDVCIYMTVSFGITEYISIKDIRFYGEALSFI